MTPDAMKPHLQKMKVIDQYDLSRPKNRTRVKAVNEYAHVAEIINTPTFVSPYAERAARVISGKG